MTNTHITRIAALVVVCLAGALLAQASSPASAQSGAPAAGGNSGAVKAAKPTIVLVHGAFADGTGWQHVIKILERDGYHVIAVQNALASFAGDVQTTKRVIDAQQAPVVAVGHSYGGAVITSAAAGNANVKALVYIAAFAPDVGEAIGAYGEKYPAALGVALKPDSAGFLYIDRARFHELFARDVSATEAKVMAATQKPIIGSAFDASVEQAAWKNISSWYLVTTADQAINPELQRFYAKRIGATTTEIKSSHVPFISHPAAVAQLIKQAASGKVK